MNQVNKLEALEIPIEQVKGIGAKRGAVLRETGIETVRDLFYYLPRRYLDRSTVLTIGQIPAGQEVTLIGQVRQRRFIPGPKPRFTLIVEDDTDDITCVWFQGGRYMQRNFNEGDELALSGKVELFQGRRQMTHPEYEFVSSAGEQGLLHTGGIIPLYTTSADMKERGLRSRGFRRLVHGALEEFAAKIEDDLPAAIRQRLELMDLHESLKKVHFPQSLEEVRQARRRLAFDELFNLQLRLARLRQERLNQADGIAFKRGEKLGPKLFSSLPFALTGAQLRVIDEILADMEQPIIMNRLLQGDVGSGKTLVALAAMLNAVENGYQAALMAPTEILAEQHYANVRQWVEPFGVQVRYLVGGQRAALRRELLAAIADGSAAIVVGTHALIQEGVEYANLGMAVVDEQHRFGVEQRAKLYGKGHKIDVLVMTATPIPRTLAMTEYGDLEVSVIDELPPGRRPVRTALRRADRRPRIFAFAADEVRAGRQVYVVYPLIAESEKMDLKSAEEGFEELQGELLRGFKVALLHGQMDAAEKSTVMEAFKDGEIQVLVSTTVIEVGVDVPNATVMIIEHAERFGLAQLHQLRGRVGRGGEQSYCIMVTDLQSGREGADAIERLETMCMTQDGFEIAEKDLEIRGPGEIFGTRQSGLPEFVVADLVDNEDLLRLARREALRLVEEEMAAGE